MSYRSAIVKLFKTEVLQMLFFVVKNITHFENLNRMFRQYWNTFYEPWHFCVNFSKPIQYFPKIIGINRFVIRDFDNPEEGLPIKQKRNIHTNSNECMRRLRNCNPNIS